jgi:adenine-specific DNA methylase
MTYSDDGLIHKDEVLEIMGRKGACTVYAVPHRGYLNAKAMEKGVVESWYFVQCA